jgi:hypothetical protein
MLIFLFFSDDEQRNGTGNSTNIQLNDNIELLCPHRQVFELLSNGVTIDLSGSHR